MSNITVTYRDGRVAQLEQVYIRGSKIRFLILPDMLKNAPMLKSMKNKNQGSGAGRGKAAILKAQGGYNLLMISCLSSPSSLRFAVEELGNFHLYHWRSISCWKLNDYFWHSFCFILRWELRLKLSHAQYWCCNSPGMLSSLLETWCKISALVFQWRQPPAVWTTRERIQVFLLNFLGEKRIK